MADVEKKVDVEGITHTLVKHNLVKHNSPMYLLELAINKDADIEKLEKLMQLKERWDAQQAKTAFFEALTAFQSECPPIKKTRKVAYKETQYHFAPLGEIAATIKGLLYKHGLSYRWEFSESENKIKCTCLISHIQGHTEQSSMEAGKDTSGSKNDIQSIGSARTYMQRYTLIAGLGLATTEDDTDGITQTMEEEFETMLKDWDYKSYLEEVASNLTKGTAFRTFLDSIPTAEQVQKFKQLLAKVPEVKHLQLWKDFSKLTNKTAPDWLAKFEDALTKKG